MSKATGPTKPPKVTCKCGVVCDELGSYFGVPMHRRGNEWRVCRLWSGLPR